MLLWKMKVALARHILKTLIISTAKMLSSFRVTLCYSKNTGQTLIFLRSLLLAFAISSVIMIIIYFLEIDREMAIALVNSDFRSNVKDSDEWDDYSPCDEHFDTRYAIGTHAADYHELKDWSSLDAHPTYVST